MQKDCGARGGRSVGWNIGRGVGSRVVSGGGCSLVFGGSDGSVVSGGRSIVIGGRSVDGSGGVSVPEGGTSVPLDTDSGVHLDQPAQLARLCQLCHHHSNTRCYSSLLLPLGRYTVGFVASLHSGMDE